MAEHVCICNLYLFSLWNFHRKGQHTHIQFIFMPIFTSVGYSLAFGAGAVYTQKNDPSHSLVCHIIFVFDLLEQIGLILNACRYNCLNTMHLLNTHEPNTNQFVTSSCACALPAVPRRQGLFQQEHVWTANQIVVLGFSKRTEPAQHRTHRRPPQFLHSTKPQASWSTRVSGLCVFFSI